VAQVLSLIFLFLGAAFMLVAAIGVARMPDLFMRLHASTKSATLGAGCLMLGAAIHFLELGVAARALAVMVFFIVTAPISAHVIGRAAYFARVPLWEGTLSDELRGRYDEATHDLASPVQSAESSAPPAG
jgi:multicomponent Na+:H+ antiporter subunit G